MKLYNILAIPTLVCGPEILTQKQRDIRRPKTAEMKFMRHTARQSLLFQGRYESTLEELGVDPAGNKLS
jgi:hypothetical protein